MKNGLHKNLSNDDYHANQTHYSSSRIKEAKKSLAHFKNYEPIGYKDEFKIGNAFEAKLADPEDWKKYKILKMSSRPEPEKTMGSKLNKEWLKMNEEAIGKEFLLNDKEGEIVESMVNACFDKPLIKKIVERSEKQWSIFGIDRNGLPYKTRPDLVLVMGGEALIVDIKSTRDASRKRFGRQSEDLEYPLQLAMQVIGVESLGLKVREYLYLACEKCSPSYAEIYNVPLGMIASFKEDYYYYSKKLVEAIETGNFPSYTKDDGSTNLQISTYYMNTLKTM